jgi:hypothetical protein
MNNNKLSRIISIGIMGIIAGFGMHIINARNTLMGRDAFLAKEAARYDRHLAHPDSIAVTIIVGLIMSCVYFGLYELLAFVLRKILDKSNANDSGS